MLEANREALAEIPELVARGVPSLKVFLAYSQLGEPMEDEDLLAVWKAVAAAGGIMQAHCESWPIIRPRLEAAMASGATGYADFAASRPPISEADAVGRALAFAAASGAETYCVHLSTSGAVEHLRLARMHGLDGPRRVLPAPPAAGRVALSRRAPGRLRDEPAAAHRRAPRGALGGARRRHARGRRGRPCRLARADQGARAGLPRGRARRRGQRPAAAARWRRRSARSTASAGSTSRASTAENPARIFRLPDKGAIAPGKHADLVVLHPGDVTPVPQVPPYWQVDNGIFRDLPHVPPRTVLQRGRTLARDGAFVGEPAAGRFVRGRNVTSTGACETTESTRIGGS